MGWQWHQLDHMQMICTSLQTDNHASTSSLNVFTSWMHFLSEQHWRQRGSDVEISNYILCNRNLFIFQVMSQWQSEAAESRVWLRRRIVAPSRTTSLRCGTTCDHSWRSSSSSWGPGHRAWRMPTTVLTRSQCRRRWNISATSSTLEPTTNGAADFHVHCSTFVRPLLVTVNQQFWKDMPH